MTKAIVFDLGGVLVDLDTDACIRAFREILGYERITELLDPCHQKGIFQEMEAGRLSADDFRAAVLAESRPGAVPEDVDRSIRALLVGMEPYKVALLNRLAGRYDRYILSNNNPVSMPLCNAVMAEAGLDWRRVFREEFVSCDLKMLKPGQEIYREAVRRIGVPPEEIVFVDDSQRNVDAAASVGIRSALYRQGDDLAALLEQMLGENLRTN